MLSDVEGTLQRGVDSSLASRKPEEFRKKKPVAISQLEPEFDDEYSVDRKYNATTKAQGEALKLKHLVKREERSVKRKLRQDGRFLARARLEEKKEKDMIYQQSIKRVKSAVEAERSQAIQAEREERRRKV